MSIIVEGLSFEGSFQYANQLRKKMGDYIIYKRDGSSDSYSRKYVGFSESVRDRVEEQSHHKRACWERETNNQPYFAAYYTNNRQEALNIEMKIINSMKIPCNET